MRGRRHIGPARDSSQLAIPASIHAAIAGEVPEATWVLLPHSTGVIASGAAEVLAKNFERATALLIGPGFGSGRHDQGIHRRIA